MIWNGPYPFLGRAYPQVLSLYRTAMVRAVGKLLAKLMLSKVLYRPRQLLETV